MKPRRSREWLSTLQLDDWVAVVTGGESTRTAAWTVGVTLLCALAVFRSSARWVYYGGETR